MGEKIYKGKAFSSSAYKGKVKARIIELRFAASGKLVNLLKRRGDTVKKGELVASLDKKSLQAELDKQLADFEKVRAEFEIYNIQKGEPQDNIAKYLKSQKQAELNVSVKEVELAKAKLDQADIFSPVEGVVIEDSDLVPGLYITPSSNPIKIIDNKSFYFEISIEQDEINKFLTPSPVQIRINGINKTVTGNTKPIISSIDGKFSIEVDLPDSSGLFFGLEGEASL